MRILLIFAALGWLISQPWIAVSGYFVLIVGAIVIMWFLSVSIERHGASHICRHKAFDPAYVAGLETQVMTAEAEIEMLGAEIEQLRSAPRASEPDPMAAVYQRVGLSKGAPPWLVASARRAYRSALHPDRHPPYRKLEAERRFKEAEAIFDQIGARG